MAELALYIDKWYIEAAVLDNGSVRPISPNNGDDRFLLYFKTDTYRNEVNFGSAFKKEVFNRNPKCYGNIFTHMVEPSAKYELYNSTNNQLSNIFADAGIFKLFRESIGKTETTKTYVSFSGDISPYARSLFIECLKDKGFEVQASGVISIERLALERIKLSCQGEIAAGYWLVLNACNENLRYCLYESDGIDCRRKSEDVRKLRGMDARRQALIEYVVDDINMSAHVLSSEQVETERIRMEQFADEWLERLTASEQNNIPVVLHDVRLSVDEHESYRVSVMPMDIARRTEKRVDDIVSDLSKFVDEAGVKYEQLVGVVFIGDTFGNETFRRKVLGKYNVINYRFLDNDLPQLLNAYSVMDLSHYEDRIKQYKTASKLEKEKIETEEEARIRATEDKARESDEESRRSRAEESRKKYKDAIDKAEQAKRNGDYVNMKEFADIALSLQPDDDWAKRLGEESITLQAKESVREETFKAALDAAKDARDANDWNTALRQAELALSLKPTSREVQRIKNIAEQQLALSADIDKIIRAAKEAYESGKYEAALNELAKLELDSRFSGVEIEVADKLRNEITEAKEQYESWIGALVRKLEQAETEEDYDTASELCEKLIDQDTAQARQWERRLEQIEKSKHEAVQISDLTKKINKARFDGDFRLIVKFCKQLLAIRDIEKYRKMMEEAQEQIDLEEASSEVDKQLDHIEKLVENEQTDEARKELDELKSEKLTFSQRERYSKLIGRLKWLDQEAEQKQNKYKQNAINVILEEAELLINKKKTREARSILNNVNSNDLSEEQKKKLRQLNSIIFDILMH